MMSGKWDTPLRIGSQDIVAGANIVLRNMGFSGQTFTRLTSEDPLYSDELSFAFFDKEWGVRAALFTAVDTKKETAWFKTLFCAPYLESEFESKIKRVLHTLKSKGVKEVRACDRAGYHFKAGIEQAQTVEKSVLNRLGFQTVKSLVDCELDLRLFSEFRKKEFLLGDYLIRSAQDHKKLLKFVTLNFGENWAREVKASFERGGVIEAIKKDEIVGFAAYSGFEREWFGPIGVLAEHRKRGVGSNLLFAALTRMREAGVTLVIIPWTQHLLFYSQTNAITAVRRLDVMSIKL